MHTDYNFQRHLTQSRAKKSVKSVMFFSSGAKDLHAITLHPFNVDLTQMVKIPALIALFNIIISPYFSPKSSFSDQGLLQNLACSYTEKN